MKYFFVAGLFFISCEVFSQQSPSLNELLKKMQGSEILPVRKPPSHFPSRLYVLKNGVVVKEISYTPAPSPPYSVYYTKEDDQLFSNLATSVKNYMADLEKKNKEKH